MFGMFICPLSILQGQASADNLSAATDAVLFFSHTSQPFPKGIIYSCDIINEPRWAIPEKAGQEKKREKLIVITMLVDVTGIVLVFCLL